jgi:hypothetical protein
MEIVLGWFMFSIVAGIIASSRGRSGFGYFMLSLILSPLIGLILAVAMPSLKVPSISGSTTDARAELERNREHKKQLESLRLQADARPTISVADELFKLAGLRDKGILTSDEFEQQKRTLLAHSSRASQSLPPPAVPAATSALKSEEVPLQALIEQIKDAGYSVESPSANKWQIHGPTGITWTASDRDLHLTISELLARGNSNGISRAV